jgi:hypothetical protein
MIDRDSQNQTGVSVGVSPQNCSSIIAVFRHKQTSLASLDTVIDSKPMFDRSGRGIGWGWSLSKRDKTSLFVRRTKRGFSATAPLPPPPEALT